MRHRLPVFFPFGIAQKRRDPYEEKPSMDALHTYALYTEPKVVYDPETAAISWSGLTRMPKTPGEDGCEITLEKEGGKIRNDTQITRLLSLRNSTKKGNSYEENHRWMHCTHMHYTLSLKSSTIPRQRQSAGVG
jgi:hypothetical protein